METLIQIAVHVFARSLQTNVRDASGEINKFYLSASLDVLWCFQKNKIFIFNEKDAKFWFYHEK